MGWNNYANSQFLATAAEDLSLSQMQETGSLHNYSSPIDDKILEGIEITASLEDYQSLAVGVDYSSKQIAFAANIHSVDMDPALPKKYYRVRDVGFKSADMRKIIEITLEVSFVYHQKKMPI